jgi:hypothetical protein
MQIPIRNIPVGGDVTGGQNGYRVYVGMFPIGIRIRAKRLSVIFKFFVTKQKNQIPFHIE